MSDLSQLSDDQLKQLYAITKMESGAAPDTSNVTSPKGASGSMQVMPATQGDPGFGVKPSNGTPQDTAREGRDYYMAMVQKYGDPMHAAMAYNWGPGNMDKWLQSGGDISKVPDETLKYAYNFTKMNPQQQQQAMEKQPVSAAKQRGLDAIQAMKPDVDKMGAGLTGAGEMVANQMSGFASMAPAGLAGLGQIVRGHTEQATSTINNIENALTYQPRTPEGQSAVQRTGEAFDQYIQQPITHGLQSILPNTPTGQMIGDIGGTLAANALPFLVGGAGMRGAGEARPMVGGAEAQLDRLEPSMQQAPTMDQTPNMGVNEGPMRPITIDRQGNASVPGMPPTADQLAQKMVIDRANELQNGPGPNDLFPDTLTDTTGHASPFEIPETQILSEAELARGGLATPDLSQATFDFDAKPKTQRQLETEAYTKRITQASEDEVDPRSETPHSADPIERPLTLDEFQQAIDTLEAKNPTKYSIVTDDVDKAYNIYKNSVGDGQASATEIGRNFANAVHEEIKNARVENHPTIKANQARVDNLQAKVDSIITSNGSGLKPAQEKLAQAQKTLDKAKDNIGKFFEQTTKAESPFWSNPGMSNLYTFGHFPTMLRSIGAVLKALHGVVFKQLDKVMPSFKNLDSPGKIFGQGIKDAINKEATREYPQKVNEQPLKQLDRVGAIRQGLKEYMPFRDQSISPEEIKQQIMQAPDISDSTGSKIAQNVIQGGLQLTNLTRHPLVKYVTEAVDKASRDTKAYVRDKLSGPNGLQKKIQSLSTDELTGIRSFMELNEGKKEFTETELKNRGFTDKQIDYYSHSLREEQDAFNKTNAARASAGQKPIDRRIAHIAGYFMGDFKALVTDADGTVRAVLSHDNRHALNTIIKRFKETHADEQGLTVGDIKLNKLSQSEGSADTRFHSYMEVLNTLGDSDPTIKAVTDAYKDFMTRDAMSAMQNRMKNKQTTGVLGAEGRKSWQSAQKNAVDGARAQLRYLESLEKWSNMQKAIADTKQFLTDPEVAKQAPNATELSTDYINSVQGRDRGWVQKMTNGALNSIAEATGLGPSIWKGMNNVQKSLLLTKFVGVFKLSHSAVTLLQPLQAIPQLNARLSARGANLGIMNSYAAIGKSFGTMMNQATGKMSGFEKAGQQFMKDNGTRDVGMSSHLRDVSNTSAKIVTARHIAEANVTIPESGARSFVFNYYAHMLKDADAGLSNAEIFGTAHNLMRDAMVDYNPHERSLMFGKMGLFGDIASTLTRFKFNQTGQHLVGAADYMRGGSLRPLMTTIMASAVLGGLRGVFGYELADQTVRGLSKLMAEMNLIKQPTSMNEIVLKSLHGMNHNIAQLLNFGAPAAMGVNMTASLTNADNIPTDWLGALFPTANEFANMGKATWDFASHPNKNTAEKFAYNMGPNSLKGVMENQFFTGPDGKYISPNTDKLESTRTPAEQTMRDFSFRSAREGHDNLVANTANQKTEQLNDVKAVVRQHALSDMMSSPDQRLTPEQYQSYTKRYMELGSDPDAFEKEMREDIMTLYRNKLQRAEGIPNNGIASIEKYLRVQGMK